MFPYAYAVFLPFWLFNAYSKTLTIVFRVFTSSPVVVTAGAPTGEQVTVGPPALIYVNPPVQVNTSTPVIVSSPAPGETATTTPATAPIPAPASSTVLKSKVEMVLEGISAEEFPSKQADIVAIIAQAAGVPPEAVVVMFGECPAQ